MAGARPLQTWLACSLVLGACAGGCKRQVVSLGDDSELTVLGPDPAGSGASERDGGADVDADASAGPEADGATAQGPCGTCPGGEVCAFPDDDDCNGEPALPRCEPIAVICPGFDQPICGCDGQSYSRCEANALGVRVRSDGVCDNPGSGAQCTGFDSTTCPPGEYCRYPFGALCGAIDSVGSCQPRPASCVDDQSPVCGCDGQTYSSACLAAAAGISVAHRGPCGGGGGWNWHGGGPWDGDGIPCSDVAGSDCPPDTYCALERCDSNAGTCAPRPPFCQTFMERVCGCDGNNYFNACAAAAAGVSVDATGACF